MAFSPWQMIRFDNMSEVFKIIGTVDIDKIKAELKGKKVTAQFPLQTDETGERSAVGSNYELRDDEKDFCKPIYDDMPYTNSIIEKYGMYRTRVMKLLGGSCYTVHVDNDPRIHIPLVSDDKNYFICNDELIKMPADGSVYLVDTRYPHTAINASSKRFIRTHILGNVNDFR